MRLLYPQLLTKDYIMRSKYFTKTTSKKKFNPFLNKTIQDVKKPVQKVEVKPSTSDVVRSLDDMERVMKNTLSKAMPSQIKANVMKKNPNRDDFREVITHLQFPEDKKLEKVTPNKIQTGLKKGYLCNSRDLNYYLGHLFCDSTINEYLMMKNPTSIRTAYNMPKPIVSKKRRYFVKQDVAFYVQYIEELRAEGIAKRKLGYLVPQKDRDQLALIESIKKKNIAKFKVGVKNVLDYFSSKLA